MRTVHLGFWTDAGREAGDEVRPIIRHVLHEGSPASASRSRPPATCSTASTWPIRRSHTLDLCQPDLLIGDGPPKGVYEHETYRRIRC